MTAKEKAKELVDRFRRTHIIAIENTKGNLVSPYKSNYIEQQVYNLRNKIMALICVDEVIKNLDPMVTDNFEFYKEVKKEIQKL